MNTKTSILLLLLVLAGTIFSLVAMAPDELPVVQDTSRDLVLARRCVEGGRCLAMGASTSVEELHQGAAWMWHVATLQSLGANPHGIQAISFLAIAIALALLMFAGETEVGPGAGLLAAAATLVYIGATGGEFYTQWNPSLMLLPATLLHYALLHAARFRSFIFYIASALCLSVMVQLHPVAMIDVPLVLLVFALFRPPRWPLVLATAVAVFVGSLLSMSWDAVFQAGTALQALSADVRGSGSGEAMPLGYLAYVVVAAGLTGLRLASLETSDNQARRQTLVLGIIATGAGAAVVTLALVSGRIQFHRYLIMCIPGLALLAGAAPQALRNLLARYRGFRPRLPALRLSARPAMAVLFVVTVALCSLALARTEENSDTVYSYRDAAAAARGLETFGIRSYEQAARQVRAPALFYLLSGLQVYLGQDEPNGHRDGPMVTVLRSSLPPLEPTPDGWWAERTGEHSWIYVFAAGQALDWSGLDVAFHTGNDALPNVTYVATGVGLDPHHVEPGIPQYEGMTLRRGWDRLYARLPIRVESNRALILMPYVHLPQHGNRAEILRITGMAHSISDRGGRAVVGAGQAGKSGLLEVVWHFHRTNQFMGFVPPFVFEVPVDDEGRWAAMEGAL